MWSHYCKPQHSWYMVPDELACWCCGTIKELSSSHATPTTQLVKSQPEPWPYPFPRNRKFKIVFGDRDNPRLVMEVYGDTSSIMWERHAALRLENERMEVVAL